MGAKNGPKWDGYGGGIGKVQLKLIGSGIPGREFAEFGTVRPRVQIPGPRPCHVSGHRGHLSHDIVDECTAAYGLVIASRVQGQLAEQGAFFGEYANVVTGDENAD